MQHLKVDLVEQLNIAMLPCTNFIHSLDGGLKRAKAISCASHEVTPDSALEAYTLEHAYA